MKNTWNLFTILVVILQFYFKQCQEVPSFRIVAPQTLCKEEESETSIQADGVAISFQPKDGIKLSYKFKIFFKLLGPDPLTQRETLLVWKAVRTLEQQLNTKERLTISKNNMAMILKSQVVPGVSYIFHVVGITDAGETTREQVFSLDYAEGVLQNSNVPEGINFLLIGSEEIVANMEYNVMAKVSFCKPKYDYYIQWKLDELDGKYRELENTISSVLTIPANVLMPNRKTSVEAQVREWKSNRLLARDNLMVEVLNKGFQAMIIPTAARIGQGSILTFRIFIRNFDQVLETNVQWQLRDANTNVVLVNNEDNENEFKVKFEKAGLYQIMANVTINEISSRVKSEVEVVSSLFISYDFQEVPNLNPSSNEEFKFSVIVMNLVANCEASWLSAQEDGFKFIARDVLDKEYYGYTRVTSLEKYYLEEIADFSNSTVNREITLHIPRKEINNELTWPGFEGDAMYKFRLDVTCPKPYLQNGQQIEGDGSEQPEEPWKKVVTSYFTIDLHTNSPPQALKVFIEPLEGMALTTPFTINSQEAKDLLLDSPVRYELKIQMDQFLVSFGKYFAYKTWEIILPFTEKPLQVIVEMCDIRQACSSVINDTKISVRYEDLSDGDYEEYVKKVNARFMSTDFQEAFNYVTIALLTFRNGQSQYRERFENYAKVLITKEIEKLLEQPDNRIYISPDTVHEFVERSKQILDYTQQLDKQTIEKLLEILENLIEAPKVEEKRFRREILKRTKRIVNQNQDLYQRTQILLLEDLLKAEDYSPEAVNRFIEKISKLSQKICLKKNLKRESLKTPMVSLTWKQIKGDNLQYPSTTQITEDLFDKLIVQFKAFDPKMLQGEAKYCLVIKSFNFRENLNDDDESSLLQYNIYEIIDDNELREWKLQEMNTNSGNVQLDIYPSERRVNKCFMKTSYTSPQWSSDACKSAELGTFLRCSCSQTGFLKASLIAVPTTTTTLKSIVNSDIAMITPSTPVFMSSALPTFISLTTSTMMTTDTTAFAFANAAPTTPAPPTPPIASTLSPALTTLSSRDSSTMRPPPTPRISVQQKPTSSIEQVQRASPLSYIIPLIFILILLILGILFFLHRRRMQQTSSIVKNLPSSMTLELRKPASGIKYANIQDEHMLSGNF
ncbi:uncharacterized protein LOC142226570 [Haematobia irritans]|uniref:uncharacterized protein LOC142226570 n=1 Tax=Haematobia irritans TaxID=7368 RepID=UPI003F4F6B54